MSLNEWGQRTMWDELEERESEEDSEREEGVVYFMAMKERWWRSDKEINDQNHSYTDLLCVLRNAWRHGKALKKEILF